MTRIREEEEEVAQFTCVPLPVQCSVVQQSACVNGPLVSVEIRC